MSYTNLIMYNAVLPSYNKPEKEQEREKGKGKTEPKQKIKPKSFGEFMSQMKQLKGNE